MRKKKKEKKNVLGNSHPLTSQRKLCSGWTDAQAAVLARHTCQFDYHAAPPTCLYIPGCFEKQ